MTNSRNGTGNGDKPFAGEELVLSTNITVYVLPFPSGSKDALDARAAQEFPLDPPPKKKVAVFDGEDEVDDLNDPDYLVRKATVEAARNNLTARAILDECVEVDLAAYPVHVARWKRHSVVPDDLDLQRVAFLEEYAFRTKADWEKLMAKALGQVTVSDEDARQRLTLFPGNVEGATGRNVATPRPAKAKRLAI